MTDFTSTYSDCPRCGSTNLVEQSGQNEPTSHYGRLLCGNCGRFLQWLSDPKIALQQQSRISTIDKILLIHNHILSQWERNFLKNTREQRHLSPKQQERLNAIGLKYLGVHICATDAPAIKNPVPGGRGVSVY